MPSEREGKAALAAKAAEKEATAPKRAVVALEGVRRVYLRGEERVTALDGVSLALRPGTFTVVLGPSGGGKSTLLHLLGGMDRPDEGRVLADGRDIARLRSDAMAAYRRTEVGFVFQAFHLLAGRTALENVELPMLLSGVPAKERRRRALALLTRVGLADRAFHRPNQLSGGQAQRVAIARALAMDPPILLADEPTGNLDSASGEEVVRLLVSLAHEDGRTVVVVTHNAELEPLADRVIRIRDGRVVRDEVRAPASGASAVSPASLADRTAGEKSVPRTRSVPFRVLVGEALGSARRRLGRAVLTGLGVAIGIAAMVLLVGLGAGLEHGVVGSITSLGPLTSITVSPQATSPGGAFSAVSAGPTTPITPESLRTFAAIPGVRGAYASPTVVGTMALGDRMAEAVLTPMPPRTLLSVGGILPVLAVGHWPTRPNDMVVSQTTVQRFYGQHAALRSMLGRTVRVTLSAIAGGLFGGGSASVSAGNLPVETLRVTGVTAGVGLTYVPYDTVQTWLREAQPHGTLSYPSATVIAQSVSQVSAVAKRIEGLGYGAQTMSGVVRQVESTFSVIEVGLGAIGGIALVVAGLMIAVVMSMAVMERRREIGVLRAVGARRRDVSMLFLTEAGAIGLAGGVVGVLTLVAVAAGAVPAAHAASLNPVDALREE